MTPVAALEAKTKMMSRQSILQAYSNQSFDFNQTDARDTCADINQESINWALAKAPLRTINRYLMRGEHYEQINFYYFYCQ
jgi:hypothetical protein